MKRISYGIQVLSLSLLALMLLNTAFYVYIEGWSIIDSFYFTISTITTLGYGDLVPTDDISKIVTSFTAFIGIGMVLTLFGILGSNYVRMTDEKERQIREKLEKDKVKQDEEIKQLESKVQKIKKIVKKS